ncbi:MAG: Group 1 glycosyl transferase [Patescibacteria group bacterium]|nr:Group 1 glycosyl transferase [Patescibacteria group bacterium]
MKVLFISNDPALFVEGSEVRARMRSYAEAIGELSIISRAPKPQEIHEGSLHLYGVRTGKLFSPFTLASRARTLILKQGIEIVSAQDPFEHGWAALRAVRGTSARLHVQVHTDFLSPWFRSSLGVSSFPMRVLNRIRVHIADHVIPRAAGVRAVSKRIQSSLLKRYASRIKEVRVVPIAIPSDVQEEVPLPPASFTFKLLAVGRLESEKRLPDVLKALHHIHPQYPSIGLYIAGSGREEAPLKNMVRELGLTERVVFLGARTDAQGLMRNAHAFIQASAYEGYGRTLVEAALARVPIITTDVGVVGEIFEGYRDVLSVPPGDSAAIAVQIVGLIEDESARHSLVINAEIAARKHLASSEETVQALCDDLRRTLAP